MTANEIATQLIQANQHSPDQDALFIGTTLESTRQVLLALRDQLQARQQHYCYRLGQFCELGGFGRIYALASRQAAHELGGKQFSVVLVDSAPVLPDYLAMLYNRTMRHGQCVERVTCEITHGSPLTAENQI
jgi:hypothetical protein